MVKKYIEVLSKAKIYKINCGDIKKIYYRNAKKNPVLPPFNIEAEETEKTFTETKIDLE